MAAVLQPTRSSVIPRTTTRPEVLSFEKELSYELESLAKLCSRRADHALRQRLSNCLFQLWNKYEASKYETKLSPEFLAEKQLETGDTLYQAKEYQLASVHCYGRYLSTLEGYDDTDTDWIVDFCTNSKNTESATFALRAAIGNTACRLYQYIQDNPDPHFVSPQTVPQVLSILRQLQSCSQASLQRETHYWLTYNCVLLIYFLSRRLLSAGRASAVLEPLLWAAVCMESSVPLLTLKYLRLRTDVYTAVCQCYFQLAEPRHAELFARRGLDKVHELALLEHQSNSPATDTSERAFHEATLKLGIVVFRRSVLESRLTRKVIFRPKRRPTIKEQLQQLFPRSPTEKLLVEMFPGEAARFLAVLEALAEPSRDPLAKGLPHPITNLDADTTAEVIQELLCAGTDLALRSLEHWENEKCDTTPPHSLLESAINKSDVIPLSSLLRYIRMALSYDAREVLDILLDRTLGVAEASSDPSVGRHLLCVRLLMMVEAVRGAAGGKRVTLAAGGAESQHALLAQEPGEKLLQLSALLHTATQDPALLTRERDLLQSSALLLWETLRPAFRQLHSHHPNTTRPLTSSRRGKEYARVLEGLVNVAGVLELWRPHPLICGELVLKLCCLKESLASHHHHPTPGGEVGCDDRDMLLETQCLLQKGLRWTHLFRSSHRGGGEMRGEGEEGEDPVVLMHGELVYALTRVRVKLAATLPPPATPEPTLKPSSLHRKVRERQEKAEKRQNLLSSLPAHDTPVHSLVDLRSECRHNHYQLALLSMLEAALSPRLTPPKRTNLLQEALSSLQQLDNEQGHPHSPSLPTSSPSPPPPLLLHQTPTSLTFTPAPWHPPHNQQVSYYRLYGRLAEGSNVKVRLSDKTYPGLGTEVSAGASCLLTVKDLKPNEQYVFAVAAYGKNGEPLSDQQTGQLLSLSHLRMGQMAGHTGGGSIGQTGRPIVACHPLPHILAWSYCSQCAFMAGVKDVGLKAARKLWTHFVETTKSGSTTAYRLKSTFLTSSPNTLLHHLVYSIFIHTHLTSPPLPSSHPHHPHNHSTELLTRLDLCRRLRLALDVCGITQEPSLALQAVVMIHGLLSPLLQRDIATLDVAKILIHCQSVLSEVPERLLSGHTHLHTQSSLHHTLASSSFHLTQMLLKWNKTPLLKEILTGAMILLLLTMPSTQLLHNPGIALDQSIGSQAPSLASYVTASSGLFPGLLVPRGTTGEKKNKRGGKKKTTHAAEQIADEAKSREYKAFEAFTAIHYSVLGGQGSVDPSDITGQEDPLILHTLIATLPAEQAHREVFKFRRRPQYLEFFVHLATAGMEQGLHSLVLEWAHETFTWLTRRNEIIRTTRPVQVSGGKAHTAGLSRARKTSSAHPTTTSTTSKTTAPTTRAPSRSQSNKTTSAALGESQSGKPHPPSKTTPTTSKTTPASCKALTRHSGGGGALAVSHHGGKAASRQGRRSRKGRSSLLNERLTRLLALEGVAVTREDILLKATSVLQTLLPDMWRHHKSRKRLREVCSDELTWRAQANLLLSQCFLEQLLKKLRIEDGEGDEGKGAQIVPHSLRTGVIMEGDVPTYPPVTPEYPGVTGVGKQDPLTGEGFTRPPSPALPRSSMEILCEMMRCLQRAVVLGARGMVWGVLQNACRCLWNTIHCLVASLAPSGETQTSHHAHGREGVSAAAVFGLASKPLYMALEAIADLIANYGEPLPIRQDTALEPDFSFLRRFCLLSLHTLLAQEHWEGLVAAGVRLCEGVMRGGGEGGRGEWVEEMLPIILEGQARLARRVARNSSDLQRNAIEPAAHFDPGSEGHDIYGRSGHALGRVCVPLQPQALFHRLQIGEPLSDGGAVGSMRRCKILLTQYLSEWSSSHASSIEEAAAPPTSQLPLLITHYSEAVCTLETSSREHTGGPHHDQDTVTASLLHDLGSLHLHNNNRKEAGHAWEKALRLLLRCKDSEELRMWWKEKEGGGGGGKEIQRCGTTGVMLAAILAVKIARYVHANKANVSLQYLLTASALFKSIPASSLPHLTLTSFLPPSPSPPHPSSPDLPVGINLYDDPLIVDPVTSLDSLHYCSRELVERKHPLKALPVLWLYWGTAHSHCRSPPHTLLCQSLRLQTLTQLHMFSRALRLLAEVLGGRGVPQTSCHCDLPSDCPSDSTAPGFSDNLPLTHPSNVKVLKQLMNREIPTSVASTCGQEALLRFSLARAELYIALASTSPTLAPVPVLSRGLSTCLSQPSPSPCPSAAQTPPVSSPSLVPPSSTKPSSRSTPQRQANLISPLLLENAERILQNYCLSLTSSSSFASELRARAYLTLSKLALTLHHNPTATKLGLATLRVLQTSSSSSLSPSSTVHRLWLEGRHTLALSLVGKQRSGEAVLDCAIQCEEGVREAEKFGDTQWCAEFHFAAGLHALSLSPPNIEGIMTHSQSCLQLLASLPYLSPPLSFLHARCKLLLCEAGCHSGHVTSHDATLVYKRLVQKLRQQMEEEGQAPCSVYNPILPLLSSALLQLSFSTCQTKQEPPATKQGPPATKQGPPATKQEPLEAKQEPRATKQEPLEAKQGPPEATQATKYDSLSLCREGLAFLEKSALSPDLCLKSSLMSQKVSVMWGDPATDRGQLIRELLLTTSSLSDNKVDYRKMFASCFEVAWLLCEAIPQQVAPPTTIKPKISRSVSRLAKKTSSPSRSMREGADTRRERSLPDVAGKKETYTAWCAVKTAQVSLQARDSLRSLTSQLNHPELSKPLSEKALADLPEFALLELCRGEDDPTLSSLLSSSEAVPVDLPLSRAQPSTKLTWFQVVSYAYSLLTRCFWPHTLASSPLPTTHTLTPSLHSRYHTLASLLQRHLPVFSSTCSLPSLPPSLLPGTPPATTKPHLYQHLRASDGEVTVVWYRPPPNSPLTQHIYSNKRASLPLKKPEAEYCVQGEGEEKSANDLGKKDGATLRETAVDYAVSKSHDLGDVTSGSHDLGDVTSGSHDQEDDIILGLFGFNQRAVKPPPQSGPPLTPAVEVFAVRVSSNDLAQLRDTWRQLSGAAQDNQLSGRPISRSPSRQRKQVEKNQQVQATIQVKLAEGVKELCRTLGRVVANEDEEPPHMEPHMLPGVLSILPPPSLPSSLTSQGHTFTFLHHLFHSTSPAHGHTHSY